MPHETSIRLPGRLTGVVRTDSAAPAPVGPPLAPAPSAPPRQSAAKGTAVAVAAAATTDTAERERARRVLASLTEAAASLRAHSQQLTQAVESLAVELAIAATRRFLGRQIEEAKFPLAALVRQAIDRLDTRHPIVVLLHPDDLALLERQLSADANLVGGAEFRLTADAALTRGSCKVQCQDRGVRLDLEGRLAALRQQLLDAVTK